MEEGDNEHQLSPSPTLAMAAIACPTNLPFLSFSQKKRCTRIPEDLLLKHVEKEIQGAYKEWTVVDTETCSLDPSSRNKFLPAAGETNS